MACIIKYKGKEYSSFEELFKEDEIADKVIDKFGPLFKEKPLVVEPDISYSDFLEEEIKFKNFVSENITEANEVLALDFAKKLSSKLNIPYTVISQEDMTKLFPNQPNRKNFYSGGKVYLVSGSLNESSVFHEFSHPIVKSMAKENPSLFNSLFNELSSTTIGQSILDNLDKDNYLVKDSDEYKEEAIVTMLQSDFDNAQVKDKTFLEKLFYNIKQFLRKLLGKKINISKLDKKTTLSQFLNMINEGGEFNLNIEFLKKDLMVMFETDYTNAAEELSKLSDKQIQEIIDDLYKQVQKQIAEFTKENDIFFTIKDGLIGSTKIDRGIYNDLSEALRALTLERGNSAIKKSTFKYTVEAETYMNKLKSLASTVVKVKNLSIVYSNKLKQIQEDKNYSDLFVQKQLEAIRKFNNDWSDYYKILVAGIFNDSNKDTDFPLLKSALEETQKQLNNNINLVTGIYREVSVDVIFNTLEKSLVKVVSQDESVLSNPNTGNAAKASAHVRLYGLSVKEKSRLDQLDRDTELTADELTEYKVLKNKSFEGYKISKESVAYFFNNQGLGFADNIQSYADSQNLTLNAMFQLIAEKYNIIAFNAQDRETELLTGLNKLLRKAGYGVTNQVVGLQSEKIGKDLAQKNTKGIKKVNKLGVVELVKFQEYRFKSNFKDIDFDFDEINFRLKKAIENYTTSQNKDYDESTILKFKKEYDEILKEKEQFLKDYFHRDYLPVVYELEQKHFNNSSGTYSLDLQEKALNAKRLAIESIRYSQQQLSDDPAYLNSMALDKLWIGYKRLFQITDENGNLKTGEDLAIANILTEHRNDTAQYYEFIEEPGLFEQVFAQYQLYLTDELNLDETSKEFEDKIRTFLLKNTSISITDEFHEMRQAAIDELARLTANLDSINDKDVVSDLFKQAWDILKITKDSSNQYDVDQLNDTAQITLRDLSQQISNYFDNIISFRDGASKPEKDKWRAINQYFQETGTFKSDEDRAFYENFWDDSLDVLRMEAGLTSADIERIKGLKKILDSFVTTQLSAYYLNSFNSLLDNDASKTFLSDFFLDIDYGDILNEDQLKFFLGDIDAVNALKEINPEFKEWFDRNHYLKEGVAIFDSEGKFVEEKNIYRESLGWTYSLPNVITDFNVKSVSNISFLPVAFQQNGILVIDGVPRIPSMNFMSREVKSEFMTEPIYEDYVDDNDNLVLANKNNKDQWLPKDYDPTDLIFSAVDKKYIDADYKKMFYNNRPLWNLLDHFKKQYLKNQIGLDNSQKMYLSYPRNRISGIEADLSRPVLNEGTVVNPAGWWGRKWNNFADSWFRDSVDDLEFMGQKSNPNSFTTFTRPISGSFNLDINLVSTDIFKSMGINSMSIETFKALRDNDPFINILKYTLENVTTDYINSISEKSMSLSLLDISNKNTVPLQTEKELNKKGRTYRNLLNLIEKFQEGQELANSDSKVVRVSNKISNKLSGWQTLKSFAIDPIKSWTNYVGATSQVYIKAVESIVSENAFFSLQGYSWMRPKTIKIVTDMIAHVYSNKSQSANLQLLNMMDGIPNNLKAIIGDRGSKSMAKFFASGDTLYFDRKILAQTVSINLYLAIIYHSKFEVNGKQTNLLEQIELVDGKIQTKKGVPEEYKIGFDTEGNRVIGEKIKFLKNVIATTSEKTIGLARADNESMMYRNVFIKSMFFLKKFYLKLLYNKIGARTRKGRRLHPKYNSNTQLLEQGQYTGALIFIKNIGDLLITHIKSGKLQRIFGSNAFSWRMKAGMAATLATVLLHYLFGYLMYSLFSWDTDDNPKYPLDDAKWDTTDEELMDKIKAGSGPLKPKFPLELNETYQMNTRDNKYRRFRFDNWLKFQALRVLYRSQKELDTYYPALVPLPEFYPTKYQPSSQLLNESLGLIGGGVLSEGGVIGDGLKLVTIAMSPEDQQYNEQDVGIYWGQRKGDHKIYNALYKIVGLDGRLLYPPIGFEKDFANFGPAYK